MKDMTGMPCNCASNCGCCSPKQEEKKIVIDFLYLDLSVCERCQGADKNLDDAINDVSGVLKTAGFNVVINKVNIASKELAVEYEFLSSPTIRVNGRDIDMEVKESVCKECGDLCGELVECRVYTYDGADYTEPPKALIVNAILKEIYGGGKAHDIKSKEYSIPHNLEVFFDGLNDRKHE